MAEAARFVVSIPISDLMEMALSEGLSDNPTHEELAKVLESVILAGFEEYTGESVPISVRPIS